MTELTESLLTETYSTWPRTQAALRAGVLVAVLAGLVFLVQRRGDIFPTPQPTVTPPETERLPIKSFIVREQQQAEEGRYTEHLAEVEAKTKSLLEKAKPPAAYPRDAIASLLLEVRPADRQRITKTLTARREEMEAIHAKAMEEATEQKRLAKRQRLLEEQRRREAERRAALARARAEQLRAAQARTEAERAAVATATATETGIETGDESASGTTASTEADTPTGNPGSEWMDREITAPVPKAYVTVYLKQRFLGITVGQTYIRQYHRIGTPRDAGAIPPGTYRISTKFVTNGSRHLTLEPKEGEAQSNRFEIHPNNDGVEKTKSGLALEPGQFEELWTAVRKGTWVVIRP